MQCPNCQNAMTESRYEGVLIDGCASCGGIWLDEGEIVRITKDRSTNFKLEDKLAAQVLSGQDRLGKQTLACPKCHKKMTVNQYAYNSGVYIDRCPDKHGVWLDRNEIDRIQITMEKLERVEPLTTPIAKTFRTCPVDGTRLQIISYESEELDMCPKCLGLWCDSDELQKIVEDKLAPVAAAHLQGLHTTDTNAKPESYEKSIQTRHCVCCDTSMIKSSYSYSSGIVIGRCPHGHGVWLDHSEIEKVQAFAEHWKKIAPEFAAKNAKLLAKGESQMKSYDDAIRRGREAALAKTWFGSAALTAAKIFKGR